MVKLALFEPKIPQNTGNIARLCVGLDIPLALVGKTGFSLNDKYLKRAGLDYWEHLKLEIYGSFDDFKEKHQENRILFATTKGTNPYFKIEYRKNDILMFGSETTGIPESILRQNRDDTITIPMTGKVRSINLSNSAAIVLYHALFSMGYFEDFSVNSLYADYFS